jgi:hypothetical protein
LLHLLLLLLMLMMMRLLLRLLLLLLLAVVGLVALSPTCAAVLGSLLFQITHQPVF